MSIASITGSVPRSTSGRKHECPAASAELLTVGHAALAAIDESLSRPRGVEGWFSVNDRDTFVAGHRGDRALYSVFVVRAVHGSDLAFGLTSLRSGNNRRPSGPYEYKNTHELSWLRLYRAMPTDVRQECVRYLCPMDATLVAAVGGAPAALVDITVLVGIMWLDHADVHIVRDDDRVCEIKMHGRTLRITITKDCIEDKTVAVLTRRTSPRMSTPWERQALDYKSYVSYGHSYGYGEFDAAEFPREAPTPAALANKLTATAAVVDRQDGGLCSEEVWKHNVDQLCGAFMRLGETGRYRRYQAISAMGMQLCREACIRTARSPLALYWKVVATLEREQRKAATGVHAGAQLEVYGAIVEVLVRLEAVFEVSVVPRNLVSQGVEKMAFVGGLSLK